MNEETISTVIEKLQLKINNIRLEKKEILEKEKEVEAEIEAAGYYIKNKKVVKNELTLGVIVKEGYYSQYVGEKGGIYDYLERGFAINDYTFEDIFEAKTKVHARTFDAYRQFFKFINDVVPFEFISLPNAFEFDNVKKLSEKEQDIFEFKCQDLFEMFELDYENSTLTFKYKGDSEQGEVVNGSGFEIKMYDKKFIENYKERSFDNKINGLYGDIEWK